MDNHFPENIRSLLEVAYTKAKEAKVALNAKDCLSLKDYYTIKNSKVFTDKEAFKRWDIDFHTNSSKFKNFNDFKGIYIFGEKVNEKVVSVYVGISRTIIRRLRQHGFGTKHNECTLAYLITKVANTNISRATVTNEDMSVAKEQIQNYKVAIIPVKDDYELYFLEVAIAGILKTKWNSFRTH